MKQTIYVVLSLIGLNLVSVSVKALEAEVNENVELLSILSRTAGYEEYCMDMAGSYTADIDSCFRKYASHPAVLRMKDWRTQYGISFDAVMSMAVHLERKGNRVSLVREDYTSLDKRWEKVDKDSFLNLLSSFYTDSRFHTFFASHQDFYRRGLQIYREKVLTYFDENWYPMFYGKAEDERFTLIIGFCNGGGNYGPSRTLTGEKKENFAIVGYNVDENDMPQYNKEGYLPTLVHEFNHSFINPLVEELPSEDKERLEQAGNTMFQTSEWAMRRQAYGDWRTLINESLVRAAVVCYMLDKGYPQAEIRVELAEQVQRNFRWTPELVMLLHDYRSNRKKYPSFASFYPKIVRFFTNNATAETKRIDKAIE